MASVLTRSQTSHKPQATDHMILGRPANLPSSKCNCLTCQNSIRRRPRLANAIISPSSRWQEVLNHAAVSCIIVNTWFGVIPVGPVRMPIHGRSLLVPDPQLGDTKQLKLGKLMVYINMKFHLGQIHPLILLVMFTLNVYHVLLLLLEEHE